MAERGLAIRNQKMKALRKDYLDYSGFLCPDCGEPCLPTKPVFNNEEMEPVSMVLHCDKCGDNEMRREKNRWFVVKDDAPYIIDSKAIATVLIHRFDRSTYEDKKEMFDDLIHMHEDAYCDCRALAEFTIMRKYAEDCLVICEEAIDAGFPEYRNDYLLTAPIIVMDMIRSGKTEGMKEYLDKVLAVAKDADQTDRLAFLSACASMVIRYADLKDLIKPLYDDIVVWDPATSMDVNTFDVARYYGTVASIAETLGYHEDGIRFNKMELDAALEVAEADGFDETQLSVVGFCFQDNIKQFKDERGKEFADQYVEFMSKYKESHKDVYANALLNRFEYCTNTLESRDVDDAFDVIDLLKDPKDDSERTMLLWAYMDLGDFYAFEDDEKSMEYYDCALDEAAKYDIKGSTGLFTIFRALCISYSALLKGRYGSKFTAFTGKLRKLGITADELKQWTTPQDAE